MWFTDTQTNRQTLAKNITSLAEVSIHNQQLDLKDQIIAAEIRFDRWQF